ncbi:para-hydroxybenzoate--polyprenyltransf erase [Plasmodium ovale wallikeri]|nr:para-hydroxybenzoate--polyprenyltransf erase [Plasmodium ovale wallikeri]SBT77842.1 para-hydroxybenzoate--polyprenyltransferase, putative [Plasmodium ovale]
MKGISPFLLFPPYKKRNANGLKLPNTAKAKKGNISTTKLLGRKKLHTTNCLHIRDTYDWRVMKIAMGTKCGYVSNVDDKMQRRKQNSSSSRIGNMGLDNLERKGLCSKPLESYFLLARMHIPTGFYLLFYSALYGYFLTYDIGNFFTNANSSIDINWKEIKNVMKNMGLFLFGAINSRIVGCIINDFCDRNYDKHVERTKNRPLANKTINTKIALLYMCIHGCFSLVTLFQFSNQTIYTGLISSIFIITYPLLKRITYYAQVYLSITFNLGFFVASSVNINLANYVLPLSVSFLPLCFLTIIYDTIYAHQDKYDDIKLNLKSLAIKWDQHTLKYSKILSLNMLYLFYLSGYLFNMHWSYYLFSTGNVMYLYYIISQTSLDDKDKCMRFFKKSKNVLLLIALASILAKGCEVIERGKGVTKGESLHKVETLHGEEINAKTHL